MRIKGIVLGLLFAGMAGVHGQENEGGAVDLKVQVKKLSEIGEEFAAGAAMSSASDNPALRDIASDYREFSNNFGSMQSSLENSNYADAASTLRRWLARTKNPAVKKALTELLAAVQVEEKKRAAALARQVDELFAKLAGRLGKATTPEDVDGLQQDLRDFRNNQFNSNNREIQKLANRVNQADNFLGNWRQFLAYQDADDWGSALGTLRNMRRESQTGGLMSGKQITDRFAAILKKRLAQMNAIREKSAIDAMLEEAVADVMAEVKSPADARNAAQKLGVILNVADGDLNSRLNDLRNGLNNLTRSQELFDRGAYARILNPDWPAMGYRDTPYDQRLEDLGTALQAKALAALTGDKNLGAPEPGQSTAAFLKAAVEKDFAAKDWPGLFTLLSYYGTISGERYSRTGSLQEGVRALIAGQQLEQAGQFRDAVRQYTLCIAEIGPFVPREEATAALKRLRATQPEAFQPEANAR